MVPALFKKFVLALAGTGLIAAETNASLMIDLRWSDGSHGTYPDNPSGGSKTIYAWAVVTGAPGNNDREGLQTVMFGIKSVVQYGTIVGGITSASLAPGWDRTGSQAGTSSNLSDDGISDWGNVSNSTLTLHPSFFRARTTKSINNVFDWGDSDSPAGSIHNNLANGGREFLVGTFTFSYTSFPSGQYPNLASVAFVPVTATGGFYAPAGWYEDISDVTAGSPPGIKTVSNGFYGPVSPNTIGTNAAIIGVIPEPSTFGLVGLTSYAFFRRRQ